jgi:hypothetical protein
MRITFGMRCEVGGGRRVDIDDNAMFWFMTLKLC